MTIVADVTPMLPVHDIKAASDFLVSCLGFELRLWADGYAYLSQGAGAIRLVSAEAGADLDDPKRQMSIYIDVDDVDAFYARHREALDALPSGHVRAPFDQLYGQREFHVIYGQALFFVGASKS